MAENWLEKIQQDADLQMLLGLAGGGLVLFVVLLIVIVVRLKNKKKKQAEKLLGDIRVQSTHTPEAVEKPKEHVVFRNKVANQELTQPEPAPEPEITPAPIHPTPTTPEIPPVVPEQPIHVPEAPPEVTPEPEPVIVPSPPTPTVVPPSASEAFNEEEKKKEILKAIEQTRSREENLRILNERLRELRGESITVETPPAPEIKPQEADPKPLEENTAIERLETTMEVQPESTEPVTEFSETLEVDLVHAEFSEEAPEVAPFVQETVTPVPMPEETTPAPTPKPESDSPKTFTEWLSALSGKKR
jgi:hypothetical protein